MRQLTFLLLPLALAACGDPGRALERLAARGEVQADAPVRASTDIRIDAPPARVWALLAAVSQWPEWWTGVSVARIDGPSPVKNSEAIERQRFSDFRK